MADVSPRFALPFIHPGQAQKELFHNEALALVDAALHPVVEALDIASPPPEPLPGEAWVIAADPQGDWSGRENQIAICTSGGWRYIAPVAGMSAWLRPADGWVGFDGTSWGARPLPTFGIAVNGKQVVGPQFASIANPNAGPLQDTESRAAIGLILDAMRHHGLIAA